MTDPGLTPTALGALLASGLFGGFAVALAVSPVLFSEQFQSLFRYVAARRAGQDPGEYLGDGWLVVYALAVSLFAAPLPTAFFAVDLLTPVESPVVESAAFFLVSHVYGAIGWYVAVVALPDRGYDWVDDPEDRAPWVFAGAAVWFALAAFALGAGAYFGVAAVL